MSTSFTSLLGTGSSGRTFGFMSETTSLAWWSILLEPLWQRDAGKASALENDQIQKLREAIARLKKVGVTGGSVVYSFISHRVQCLQKRAHY